MKLGARIFEWWFRVIMRVRVQHCPIHDIDYDFSTWVMRLTTKSFARPECVVEERQRELKYERSQMP